MLFIKMRGMIKVFDVQVSSISKHLKNIFEEQELDEKVVVSKMENITKHVAIEINVYSLDSIIAVRYRINSKKVTEFRRRLSCKLFKKFV